ncbi:DUF58 domain-containing protein [Acinetobacter sp. MB5]|uniref:DUF58 domain-containing protein n=1 Tax=Acinetobacter sp. MB5 TaxID=2069438 RepID=UPI000DD0235F|nr:DUF58 domain-containing protein [Acinetobacter sp. MB5]
MRQRIVAWMSRRFEMQAEKKIKQRDILVFLHRDGVLYGVLILLTFVAGVNYANNLVLSLCFLVSAILAMSFYLAFKQLHGLKIELLNDDDVGQVDQPFVLRLRLQQNKASPRFLRIQIAEQTLCILMKEQSQDIHISLHPKNRGLYPLPRCRIQATYPFGVVRAWTYLYFQHQVWVAPQPVSISSESKLSHQHQQQNLDEFHDLRNYVDGDTLQRVSWKHVARDQGWFVKRFEQEPNTQIQMIDYVKMPSAMHEVRLSMMMAMVDQCEQEKRAYSMLLPKAELGVGSGIRQYQQAKKLLAQA